MNTEIMYQKTPESREEWLELRRKGIGGSDVAAVIGISPWQTPLTVFLDKRPDLAPEGYAEAREAKRSANLALPLGSYLEEFVAKHYAEKTGKTVRRYGFMIMKGHLIGDVDRLVSVDGSLPAHHSEVRTTLGLEIKTTSEFSWDAIPDHYLAQIQTYMHLLPMIESFDVAALFKGSSTIQIFNERRDDETGAEIEDLVEAFWGRFVEPGVFPPASSEEDCRLRWAKSRDKAVPATPTTVDEIRHLVGLEAQKKAIEDDIDLSRGVILAAIEDADTLVDSFGKKLASYKSSKDRTVTDWEAVAKEALGLIDVQGTPLLAEDIVARHTETKPGARSFRLSKLAKEL